jgi:hypothetical protein
VVKVNAFLSERFKQASHKLSKMTNLAEMSSNGELSSFAGLFRVSKLTPREEGILQEILNSFRQEEQEIERDFDHLSSITSEVKAINNQAAILHGERIKKAQEILRHYKEGAFTAWLIATYGNRQTPYNFLYYYELHTALPQPLHTKLDEMPRQVVYVLASRSGALEKKEEIIKNYRGESKDELLSLIRQTFPLARDDRRSQDLPDYAITALKRLYQVVNQPHFAPTPGQKKIIKDILNSFRLLTD